MYRCWWWQKKDTWKNLNPKTRWDIETKTQKHRNSSIFHINFGAKFHFHQTVDVGKLQDGIWICFWAPNSNWTFLVHPNPTCIVQWHTGPKCHHHQAHAHLFPATPFPELPSSDLVNYIYVFVLQNCQCVGVSLHGQSVGQVKMIGEKGTRYWHCEPTFSTDSIDTFKYVLTRLVLFWATRTTSGHAKNTFTNNRLFYETTLYPPALTTYVLFHSRASLSCSASASCHGCCKNSTLHTLGKYLRERGKKNDSEQSGGTMIDSNRGCGKDGGKDVGCVQFHIQWDGTRWIQWFFLFGVLHVGIPIKYPPK